MSNVKDFKLSTVGKDDFPELEGKVVDVITLNGNKKGIVVGCNLSIGITIVDVDNKDAYLLCYTGPSLPGVRGHTPKELKAAELTVQMIEQGKVDFIKLMRQLDSYGHFPDADSCAYNQ